MNTVVKELFERIEALADDDRAELERLIAERREEEWRKITAEAAAEADRRGITDEVIQQTIERMRYGK